MSGLVYVLAKAPWGPVRVGHAGSMGDLLRLGEQPAHIEQCDTADPAEVARLALQGLDPAGTDGWIVARADKATQAVKEAYRAVSARVVATVPIEASLRPALPDSGMTANDRLHARAGTNNDAGFSELSEALERGPSPDTMAVIGSIHARARVGTAGTAMSANVSSYARERADVTDGPMRSANESIHAPAGAREVEVAGADVRSIRLGLRMTQAQFAQAFGFPVATVAGWEQGRFRPDGPAQILLRVIRHRPDAVREALATP